MRLNYLAWLGVTDSATVPPHRRMSDCSKYAQVAPGDVPAYIHLPFPQGYLCMGSFSKETC